MGWKGKMGESIKSHEVWTEFALNNPGKFAKYLQQHPEDEVAYQVAKELCLALYGYAILTLNVGTTSSGEDLGSD